MLQKNILPVRVYTFNSSKTLLEETIKNVKELEYKTRDEKNFFSKDNLVKNSKFNSLIEWFHECINQASEDIGYHFKLKISVSWANKNSAEGGGHHIHTHPNSLLDGVYYLTSSDSSKKTETYNPQHFLFKQDLIDASPGDTIFFKEDVWKDNLFFDKGGWNRHGLKHVEKAEAGKLILFPSTIFHGVLPYKNEILAERYTIAFNSFPYGELSRNQLESLNITVN